MRTRSLLFGPQVERAELVARGVPFEWRPERPSSIPAQKVPLRVIPEGYTSVAVLKGGQYLAVIAQPSAAAWAEESILVYTARWSLVRKVGGLPQAPRGARRWLTGAWDNESGQLGVVAYISGPQPWIEVGSAEVPSLHFVSLYRVPEALLGMRYANLLWAKGKMILVCSLGSQNLVVEADPARRRTRRLYVEDATDARVGAIDRAAVSPEGTWLAFDRRRVLNEPEAPSRSGVLVVELSTGTCKQLTYEASRSYYHSVVAWEDDSTVLVSRAMSGGKSDIYRVGLR